ncbi:ParB N-terminal domain-containing protein [Pseudonocardia xishanensis]|uniref:ParB-like nuclease family protein n=1 Tax=Pseudonocardia xishanensis TaxID=630995 RepID=A0ABP8S1A9_9PSEU
MTLLHLDPHALIFAANVRTEIKLAREFVASVRERGVLQPVVAYPGEDGPVVEFGHRRTLAAWNAGWPVSRWCWLRRRRGWIG